MVQLYLEWNVEDQFQVEHFCLYLMTLLKSKNISFKYKRFAKVFQHKRIKDSMINLNSGNPNWRSSNVHTAVGSAGELRRENDKVNKTRK